MTFEEAESLIRRLSYKPGTIFSIVRAANSHSIHVRIGIPVRDADRADQQVMTMQSIFFSLSETQLVLFDEGMMIGMMRTNLKTMEIHEVDEWFRLDKKYMTDPHPELRKKHEDIDDYGL